MMKSRILVLVVFCLVAMVMATGVVIASTVSDADYYGVITISNTDVAADGVSTNMTLSTQNMISAGFLNSSANNCAIQNTSGSDVSFMPAPPGSSTWCIYVPTITGYTYITNVLYTGNVTGGDINYFPGDAGMLTSDAASMEPSDNFTMQLSGMIHTSVSDNVASKQDAVLVFTSSASENITATVTDNLTPTGHTDPSGTWDSETLAYDNNVATRALCNPVIGATSWSDYLQLDISDRAITCDAVSVWADVSGGGAGELLNVDIYYDAGWHTIHSGTYDDNQWYEIDIGSELVITQMRIRLYNDTGGGLNGYIYETQFNYVATVSSNESDAEHDLYVGMDGPFYGMGIDPSTFALCVSDNLVLNAPLWQREEYAPNAGTFLTIDGTEHVTTVNGVVWSTDGYTFDGGAGDNIQVTDSDSFNFSTNNFAHEMWYRPADLTTSCNLAAQYDADGGDATLVQFYKLSAAAGNKLGMRFINNDVEVGEYRMTNNWTASVDTWYHIVWARIGASGYIYVNGVAQTVTEITAFGTLPNANSVWFLSPDWYLGGGNYINGIMGEMRIYNGMFSSVDQITQNYNATKSKHTTGDIYQRSTLLSVQDNANDWYVGGRSTPYIEQYQHTVGGNVVQDISWEYAATFTDASAYGNDATPSFRTSSSDADVLATLYSFGPVTEADAPAYTLSDPPDFITTSPGMTGNFTTTANYTYPGRDVIVAITAASDVPEELPTVIMVTLGLLFISFAFSAFARSQGHGSIFIKIAIIFAFMCVLAALRIYDTWQLYMFAVMAIGIMWLSRQREAY